ncbi:MAG: hypothetical protein GF387_02835 [Candidatus Portnoybacteria bacterium]|nr:hypothetical protein [Candidatus Portnoybacteria bacterium]
MQFQVPQYTDIEDKVIGPLTIKQFMYLLVAGIIIFIFYKLFNFAIFIILSIPIALIAITFAFVKIHDQPFSVIVINFFSFLKKPDYYVWKRPKEKEILEQEEEPKIIKREEAPKRQEKKPKSRLNELNWKIEIKK